MSDKEAVVDQYKKISVLLLDVGGEEHFSLLAARCLGAVPGVNVHVVASSAWLPVRFSRSVRSIRVVSEDADEEEWIEALIAEARRVHADVLLPVAEGAIRLMIRHSVELKEVCCLAPIPSLKNLDTAGDKWLLFLLLKKLNIPAPRTLFYDRHEEFIRALDTLAFPLVFKPTGWWGGRGSRRFNDRPSLCEFVDRNRHLAGHYIAQEFIAGRDAACNVLCRDGEVLAQTLQRGYLPPAYPFGGQTGTEFFDDPKVFQWVASLAKELSWNGVACVDLRLGEADGSPYFLEVNPRYWRSLMGSLVAGVNFPYLACLAGMGQEVKQPSIKPVRYVVENGVAFKRRLRWRSGKAIAESLEEHTSLEFAARDPFPEVFMLLRRAFGRSSPEALLNRMWKSRISAQT